MPYWEILASINAAIIAAIIYLARQIVKIRERVIRLEERLRLLRRWPDDDEDD